MWTSRRRWREAIMPLNVLTAILAWRTSRCSSLFVWSEKIKGVCHHPKPCMRATNSPPSSSFSFYFLSFSLLLYTYSAFHQLPPTFLCLVTISKINVKEPFRLFLAVCCHFQRAQLSLSGNITVVIEVHGTFCKFFLPVILANVLSNVTDARRKI